MNWFDKIIPPKIKTVKQIRRSGVPEGLWNKCTSCQAVLYAVELARSLQVCPKCNHHMRIGAKDRLYSFFDQDSVQWLGENITPIDVFKFKDQKKYKDRLQAARKTSKTSEALLGATGQINGVSVAAVAFEFKFMGGSMGSVVGERFFQTANHSLENHQPLISFAASGGARMQEALFSLMQMSKTAAIIAKLKAKGIPYISVLTDPTTGGVSASLAMLGDIIIAEPKALVGFAGPRVIEQTVRETLPDGFQRAEFLLAHGAIDMIVNRQQLKQEIYRLLDKLGFAPPNIQSSTMPALENDHDSDCEDWLEGEWLSASDKDTD